MASPSTRCARIACRHANSSHSMAGSCRAPGCRCRMFLAPGTRLIVDWRDYHPNGPWPKKGDVVTEPGYHAEVAAANGALLQVIARGPA